MNVKILIFTILFLHCSFIFGTPRKQKNMVYARFILCYENVQEEDSDSILISEISRVKMRKGTRNHLIKSRFFRTKGKPLLSNRAVDIISKFETINECKGDSVSRIKCISSLMADNKFYLGGRLQISETVDGYVVLIEHSIYKDISGFLLLFEGEHLRSIVKIYSYFQIIGSSSSMQPQMVSANLIRLVNKRTHSDVVQENPSDYFSYETVDFFISKSGNIIVK